MVVPEDFVLGEKRDPILDNLRKEISETQQRREKLQLLKIGFVSALLGFGGIDFKGVGSYYQALYVVPLIATFFDLLIQGEHFLIRRAGTFLRMHSSPLERKYESFVSKHRDIFFKYGSSGFTSLSYFASIVLLWNTDHLRSRIEWLWFFLLFATFVFSLWHGNRRLKALDSQSESDLGEKGMAKRV